MFIYIIAIVLLIASIREQTKRAFLTKWDYIIVVLDLALIVFAMYMIIKRA
jgi:uncharacterized membrane protein